MSFRGILVIFRFWSYFGHFLGIFWSFLGFWDILVISFWILGYFGHFVCLVVILVILSFLGILVIFEHFRVLWSFTLYGHFGNFDN